jgi:hypothetical protein
VRLCPNIDVVASVMASERILSHFMFAPRFRAPDVNRLLLPICLSKARTMAGRNRGVMVVGRCRHERMAEPYGNNAGWSYGYSICSHRDNLVRATLTRHIAQLAANILKKSS